MGKFEAFLGDSSDVVTREFTIADGRVNCALIYIDGLIDKAVIHDQLMKSLMLEMPLVYPNIAKKDVMEQVKERALTVADIKEAKDLDEAMLFLMSGEVVLIIDGYSEVIVVSARGWASRGVAEPESEALVRGPRDGFTETLRTNTAHLRRKCRDPNLVIKTMQIGRRSKTDVAIAYIKGIVRSELVQEVEERLNKIDVDKILETGEIEQLIEDNVFSPFPQAQFTERPDKTVASLLEGRVAILVDGTPFALIVPTVLFQLFQSPEDYYERWIISSLIRFFRFIGSFIATFAPSIYIAMIAYHPGLIPTSLALSIAASREGVPFPAFIEALLMEIIIELLRESGARLPKAIGTTIGIVGGIVIGDAAVRAGITSPIMVIVVAITAIASFIIPSYNAAISFRLMRFPVMMLAAVLGLYGVMLGFIVINIHLVTLRSFGTVYLSPLTPLEVGDWKDLIFRLPTKYQRKRPAFLQPVDMIRQDLEEEVRYLKERTEEERGSRQENKKEKKGESE
ncbi:MAG TPA: spore germination protein [Clostridia bacterium]|nr:spore germination protein [Clostridia bacterium]